MLTKIKSAASVQTSGSAEVDVISNAKVSEHLGTTDGSINLVQTHSEKRNQDPSFLSTAHDLYSALNTRDQDSLSHLACNNAAFERPPPERDKLSTTSADLLAAHLFVKTTTDSELNVRDYEDYDADGYADGYADASAIEEANYQRYLEFITRKKPIIRVTLQEDTYQIDREGIIVLASELSLAEIGDLFLLLENSDAEFASDDDVKVDCKAVEESLDYYGTKLKVPRAEAETTLDYFQRLSLLVFYEPHRLTETGSTISATWAVWAEKFFVHGCIAYLLYLQQALAADSSDKQDLQMSDAAAIEVNILMAHENLLHNTPPTQAALKATESVEPATIYVGRTKSRWSVINPPPLRSNKALLQRLSKHPLRLGRYHVHSDRNP